LVRNVDYTPLHRPESIPTVFIEAWNNRDPDTLASIFDADAEFVNVTGLWWHDRESIRKAHAYGLEHIFDRSTLQLVKVKVKRLSSDIAVVHARMRLSGQTPVGAVTTPQTRQNIFSFVVYRLPEGWWRCASAHNTDVVPHMETNIIDDEGQFRSVNYRRRGSNG
jgi:uncharacterized protein (TIGR02246 family)